MRLVKRQCLPPCYPTNLLPEIRRAFSQHCYQVVVLHGDRFEMNSRKRAFSRDFVQSHQGLK